jgi:uncharacterized protein (TIGR00304 family)
VADQITTSIGVALVLIGFAVAFIAVIWLILSGARSGKDRGRVRGGGVVIIGPVPIIFGTDKESVKIILLLSIALVVLLLVFMLFSNGVIR